MNADEYGFNLYSSVFVCVPPKIPIIKSKKSVVDGGYAAQ